MKTHVMKWLKVLGALALVLAVSLIARPATTNADDQVISQLLLVQDGKMHTLGRVELCLERKTGEVDTFVTNDEGYFYFPKDRSFEKRNGYYHTAERYKQNDGISSPQFPMARPSIHISERGRTESWEYYFVGLDIGDQKIPEGVLVGPGQEKIYTDYYPLGEKFVKDKPYSNRVTNAYMGGKLPPNTTVETMVFLGYSQGVEVFYWESGDMELLFGYAESNFMPTGNVVRTDDQGVAVFISRHWIPEARVVQE